MVIFRLEMKKILVFICLFGLLNTAGAQSDKFVKWEFSSRKNGKTTELVAKAKLETGWHVYSQFMQGDGPIPTTFEYTLPVGVKLSGKTNEPEPIKHFDENFGMDVLFFNGQVEFVQPLSGKIKKGMVVKGKVNYMICNDEMCYPPVDVPFEIKL